jgi:branched-chain amino acid transport system permease protein
MSTALQILFDSLLLIGLYAIGALGFALIWGVLNVLNIAYAAFIMLGGYSSWMLWRLGLDPLLALPLTMALMFAFGWFVQRTLVDHVMRGPHALGIALTYGLNLVIVGLALYFFTAEFRSIVLPEYLHGYTEVGGARLTNARVVVAAIALALTAATWWFIDRTEIGSAIRATRLDPEAARLVGIRVRTIFNLTTALSAALAGAMGGLIVVLYSATPGMGDQYLLQILIVTVLGGLGSMLGPLVGAAVLGVTTSAVATLWGATHATMVGALLVLLVLMVRPAGLMGKRFYES